MKHHLPCIRTPAYFFTILVGIFFIIGGVPYYFFNDALEIENGIPTHKKQLHDYSSDNIVGILKDCEIVTSGKSQEAEKTCKKAVEDLNAFSKNKRELSAQEGMWRTSTDLIKITAVQLMVFMISTLGSLVAMFFLYKTYLATKETNEQTQLANQLNYQPYFEISHYEMKGVEEDTRNRVVLVDSTWSSDGNLNIAIRLTLKNVGKSPAHNISTISITDGSVHDHYTGEVVSWNEHTTYMEPILLSPEQSFSFLIEGGLWGSEDLIERIEEYNLEDLKFKFSGSFTYDEFVVGTISQKASKKCNFELNHPGVILGAFHWGSGGIIAEKGMITRIKSYEEIN